MAGLWVLLPRPQLLLRALWAYLLLHVCRCLLLWHRLQEQGGIHNSHAERVLLRVTLDDAASADDLFSVLMGEDVEARRSFIQRNAKDVRFLDI